MDNPIYKALQSLIHGILHGDTAPLLLSVLFIVVLFIALVLLLISFGCGSRKETKREGYNLLNIDDTYLGQKCPQCKLVSPPRAERCSCGHQFPKVEKILGDAFVMIGKPYHGPYERWRKFGNPEKGKKQFKPEG